MLSLTLNKCVYLYFEIKIVSMCWAHDNKHRKRRPPSVDILVQYQKKKKKKKLAKLFFYIFKFLSLLFGYPTPLNLSKPTRSLSNKLISLTN